MSVTISCTHSPKLSAQELEVLREIQATPRYVVANFELRSSQNDAIYTGALEHVHLRCPEEEMTPVVQRGEILEQLCEKGLIVLNYSLPTYIKRDYLIFKESQLFIQLEEAVQEAQQQQFTFDIAHITKGLAVLTQRGRYALSR